MRHARLIAFLALLASVLACAGALAATRLGRAQFLGKTVEGKSVRLRLTHDGRHVAKMRIFYLVTCDDGHTGSTYTDMTGIALKRGKFSGTGSYQGQSDGSTNDFKVKGKVSTTRASGTFSLTASGTVSGQAVHCKTGAVTWSAPRVR